MAEQFGKYRIEAIIGEGGFGTVYRAVDTGLDRPVALKILEPLLMRDAGWVSRFQREAQVLARLDHPHIVPIYETGEEGGRLYIAMKLIDRPDLRQVIAERAPLAWGEVLRILNPVAEALDYAHRNGIVHRDIKPANILLGPYGPVLTDFGFARLVSEHSMSSSISGGVVGTPAYIAPEMWEGSQGEAPADIYALACVVAEMASGQALFKGENTPAVMLAHFQPPVLPDEWPAGVPPELNTVLARALSREPGQRHKSSGAFAASLIELGKAGEEATEMGEVTVANDGAVRLPELATEHIATAVLPSATQSNRRSSRTERRRFPWGWGIVGVVVGLVGLLLIAMAALGLASEVFVIPGTIQRSLLAPSTPIPLPSTANIPAVYMSLDEAGTHMTTTYAQTDTTFYAQVILKNAPDDTVMKAVWTAISAQDTDPNLLIHETELTSGSAPLTFSLSNDGLWPIGGYKVDIYLNGKLKRTLAFAVQ